jgi:hypothetical protein
MRATIIDALHSSGFYAPFVEQASPAAEKVSKGPVFVAQPFLAVCFFPAVNKGK